MEAWHVEISFSRKSWKPLRMAAAGCRLAEKKEVPGLLAGALWAGRWRYFEKGGFSEGLRAGLGRAEDREWGEDTWERLRSPGRVSIRERGESLGSKFPEERGSLQCRFQGDFSTSYTESSSWREERQTEKKEVQLRRIERVRGLELPWGGWLHCQKRETQVWFP